jgi:hypothetical protein
MFNFNVFGLCSVLQNLVALEKRTECSSLRRFK